MDNEQRNQLINWLGRLSTGEIDTLIATIPGAAPHVAHNAPVLEKVGQLVPWVESSAGPGLDALYGICRKCGYPKARFAPAFDPTAYLRYLLDQTGFIDIKGLLTDSGEALSFSIDELYIPLTTAGIGDERPTTDDGGPERGGNRIELQEALRSTRLVIVGDPGSGKTTFLHRIACELCRRKLGLTAPAPAGAFEVPGERFPILIKLAELTVHVGNARGTSGAPATRNSPEWIIHFLGAVNGGQLDLPEEFFRHQLGHGSAMLLLDGLDEASNEDDRRMLVEMISSATGAFARCSLVVTSRPTAYRGVTVLPRFSQVRIDTLDDQSVELFVTRWCEALHRRRTSRATPHKQQLLEALRSGAEIRRLARNPVMLTALAVVHWHQGRLPEQRGRLFECVISWLSDTARRRGQDRAPPDECVRLLQELAFCMQRSPEGRQVQVSRHWAAEAIADEFSEVDRRRRRDAALRFLAQEELDSGIVVRRGDNLRFWHLTFQEYLAARAIGGRTDEEQHEILFDGDRLHDPAWREVFLLLASVLWQQGRPKLDNTVAKILRRLGDSASLAEQARCYALLAAAVQDLGPYSYRPKDPAYRQLEEAAMSLFDREKSAGVPIEVAIEAAEALGTAGDPRLHVRRRDENFVSIPAGNFWMGAQTQNPTERGYDPEAAEDESPVHEVYVDEFPIGRYPVTVAEYEQFKDDGGYKTRTLWEESAFGQYREPEGWSDQLDHPNRPVAGVSWHEATAYAQWARGRLPTEAEWERAARGTEARKYPWGDTAPSPLLLNFAGNVGRPTPVGVYPRGATPEGICDLAGNVWEWCADWYGKYMPIDSHNPVGPKEGKYRVVRVGGWPYVADVCRGSSRYRYLPSHRVVTQGFRVVLCAARTR